MIAILQRPKFLHSISHFVQEPGGETDSDLELGRLAGTRIAGMVRQLENSCENLTQ